MCGICGLIYSDKNKLVDKLTLARMNNSLAARGPDEEGYFIKDNAGLGMRRLSIIDVKSGHQPIYNEDKTICVICNGEIYNYQELREALKKRGHRFYTNSDVEIIVHLYEEDEEDFVNKLRGMFSIAIYDLHNDKLILVRDRLGIKPLFYTYQKGAFLFGSELKALQQYPDLEKKISFAALSDYLTFLYIPAPQTIFEGIYKLLPAQVLTFTKGNISLKQYWEINYSKRKEEKEQYYIERLRDLSKETIKSHLMSEVPLGAFLSGGMDSSAIIALMSEVASGPIKTFSVGFNDVGFNELKYAESVAARFGTEHHEINLKPDIINLLPKIIEYLDEPFADSSMIPTYLISEFARRQVTVCLAGDGGDELFAGYGWTRRQKFIEDYKITPAFARKSINKLLLKNGYLPDQSGAFFDKLRRFIYDAGLPLEESFMRRKSCFSEGMKKELFKEEFYSRIKNHKSISKILPYFKDNELGNLEKLLFADTKMYLPEDCLCKVDRMSMMNSLEVRVPFLDHKVVEFAAAMPFKYKMNGFISKYVLKKAMKSLLPAPILKQRKLGFTIPLNSWFRGKLKSYIKDLLLAKDSKLGCFLNTSYISLLLKEHFECRQEFGPQIFSLLVLELWLRENNNESTFNQVCN